MPRFLARFFPLFPLMLTPDTRFQDYETRWNWPWYWKLLNRLEYWSWRREDRIYGVEEANRRLGRKLRRMGYKPLPVIDTGYGPFGPPESSVGRSNPEPPAAR